MEEKHLKKHENKLKGVELLSRTRTAPHRWTGRHPPRRGAHRRTPFRPSTHDKHSEFNRGRAAIDPFPAILGDTKIDVWKDVERLGDMAYNKKRERVTGKERTATQNAEKNPARKEGIHRYPPTHPPTHLFSQAGYLRELLVSCPRASTRLAFEHLAVDAVSASSNPSRRDGSSGQTAVDWEGEPEGEVEVDHQTTALSRVLLDLLQDESHGAARAASPGGLTHVAAVAAAAAANSSQRAILIAGHALTHLVGCLKARLLHEITRAPAAAGAATGAPAAAGGASAVAIAVTTKAAAAAAAAATATPAKVLQLQHVGGFEAVVTAVGRLLAGAASGPFGGGVDQALGGGGADAVVDREFLLAALKACPRQTADFLAHLVWSGRPTRSETAGAASAVEGVSVGDSPTKGGAERELTVSGPGVGIGVGERALVLLLEIVLDARRASNVPAVAPATATTTAAEAAAAAEGAVDLRSGMGVLSRVLHLNDGGAPGRLEVALRRLEAAVRASAEEGSSQAGCDGIVYLTGKLVASLFVHLPEARAILSRVPFLSAATPADSGSSSGK